MSRDIRLYLFDMLERIAFLRSVVEDYQRDILDDNRTLNAAVEREFITLGEALSRIHQVDPNLAERISNWRNIIDFRNILVHGYFSLDRDVVWETMTNDLPRLANEVAAILEELDERDPPGPTG